MVASDLIVIKEHRFLSGKFKSGINREFTSEVKPLNPEELLELLKSTDHSAVIHKVLTFFNIDTLLMHAAPIY